LDFAKDILYIEAADQQVRRSIQTVLYESLLTLTKLVTPILPHTADEVWAYIPGMKEESVQLVDLPDSKAIANGNELEKKWDRFMELRDDVLKALEVARNEKVIGKSLTASVTIYTTDSTRELLDSIKEDLKQLFIVSHVEIAGSKEQAPENAQHFETVSIVIKAAEGETCERCWVVTPTVGGDNEHPTLCTRCADVIKSNYHE
jgi:isoleucyl-tRNA synthetase